MRETDLPIPRGQALDLDDDELALLAAVGPDDLARAESLWRAANAGTVTADLMAATEEEEP